MTFFLQKTLYGSELGGVERIRTCDTNNGSVEKFDAMVDSSRGSPSKEMDFDLSNPTCLGAVLTAYIGIKASILTITCGCGVNCTPRVTPSPIKDSIDLAKSFKAAKSNNACTIAIAAGLGGTLTSFAPLFGIYAVAKQHFENVRVCGSDWKNPDPGTYTNSKFEGSYAEAVFNSKSSSSNIQSATTDSEEHKKYREWFYNGKEFSDNPHDGETCVDPSNDNKPQKYYFQGLKPANYFCEKYNPIYHDDNKENYKKAYKCCLNRSQNYICLEKKQFDVGINAGDNIFCKADSKCAFKKNTTVTFEAYRRDNGRLICAKSYSLCPYNFSVGGGTVYPKYFRDGAGDGEDFKPLNPENITKVEAGSCSSGDKRLSEIRDPDCKTNNKLGKLQNYCQYFTHCTVVGGKPYVSNLDMMSPYYAKACIDFVGDSQNGVIKFTGPNGKTYNGGLMFGQQKNFSAPIVQCLKETVSNIFTNTAGHSRCRDGSFGNSLNECKNSSNQDNYATIENFVYKKGNKVKTNSLFENLQKKLKMIITAVLSISVTFLGFKILMGKVDLGNKKEILVYLVKIGFVIYFVNGSAWKDIFFDGIYNGSSEISRILFKIRSAEQDGGVCNFGAQYNLQGTKNTTSVNYPAGKEYLMVWDTLDCKIMQYLNYKPGFSSTAIFLLIIAAFFTGGIGITLSFSILIMAFCLIATVIRAMHIFVSSAIAIVIYIFVSPIIIPLILFEKTKSIFDAWLSHLVSFTLSPIVLFAYLAIFITLSEEILFSGAKSFKDGNVDCSKYCIDINGERKSESECLPGSGSSDIINPLNESVACIINFNDFKTDNGFALFGIAFPAVGKLLEPGYAELRIILVLKTALFLYVLAQFMDEIPGITSRLTGESIDVKGINYLDAMRKFNSVIRGVQKRGARLTKRGAKSLLSKTKDGASKSNSKADSGGGGGDSAGPSSGGGGADGGGAGAGGGDGGGGGGDSAGPNS